ncbi:hypothetical protein MKW98_007416 [Papaver atlanticum]|uniref:Ribosome biogenesis regulatory protein n=1 Tax=Papaver atlanticum TaxID=357466 RepID=A0AAD4SCI7_9MAGN|nr:hypothetical protein MKW98_007416 [Papaver atlanticum]
MSYILNYLVVHHFSSLEREQTDFVLNQLFSKHSPEIFDVNKGNSLRNRHQVDHLKSHQVMDRLKNYYNLHFSSSRPCYYCSLCNLFKNIKVAMLDLLKSLMKAATVLDFKKSLLLLPEECLKSKAMTLNFCESLDALPLTEERKSWLLQKTVESDITSAYDDASKSLVEYKQWECFYIMKLREILGAVPEHQEEIEEQEEDQLTDDMDSLKKCLEAMAKKIDGKLEQQRQLNLNRNPSSLPREKPLPVRKQPTAWRPLLKQKVLRTTRKTRLSMMKRLIHGVTMVMIV